MHATSWKRSSRRSSPTTRTPGSWTGTEPGNGSALPRATGENRPRRRSCDGGTVRAGSRVLISAVRWLRQHGAMPVGVVDVGSNTVRLVVWRAAQPIRSERTLLRLGADVEAHGEIPADKLSLTADVVGRYADLARAEGVDRLEVLITSPGRQAANGHVLAELLEAAAGCPVRVLTAAEEGRLAFAGAIDAASPPPRRVVAVVDVGGGSAQLVVGSRRSGPRYTQSIDLGSQRLTSRLLGEDPPGAKAVRQARAEV